MTAMEIMKRNRELELIHSKAFYMYFHFALHNYMDYLTGFDIVKFDDAIHTPDGVSTSDHIEKHYGAEATALIKRLIRLPKRIIPR